MNDAIKAVQEKKSSISKAWKHEFGIPQLTLSDKINGNISFLFQKACITKLHSYDTNIYFTFEFFYLQKI